MAAVSPPLDLSACADALEARGNRLYQRYFMEMLGEGYRRRNRVRPDLFAEGRERGLRTVREYDERITAPFGGYESATQYYERSSAGPWLASIDRPALVLAAADDPMIPSGSVAGWPLSPSVRREIIPTGGHVGLRRPVAGPRLVLGPGTRPGLPRAGRLEQGPEGLPDGLGDPRVALGGRVDAVGLVELRIAGHALEEERDERRAVRLASSG